MSVGERIEALDPDNVIAAIELGRGDVPEARQLADEMR